MDSSDDTSILRQNVLDVLGAFKAGDIDIERTASYLMEIIETGEPALYQHVIPLRAHD